MRASTGLGVLGRPDPVAWAAMSDLMMSGKSFVRQSKKLDGLRESGNVVGSIHACDAVMATEQELGYKTLRCSKLASPFATAAALSAVGVDNEEGGER